MKIPSVGKETKQWKLSYSVSERLNLYYSLESNLAISNKIEDAPSQQPASPFQASALEKLEHVYKQTCSSIPGSVCIVCNCVDKAVLKPAISLNCHVRCNSTCASKYQVVHLNYIQFLFVNYTATKMKKIKTSDRNKKVRCNGRVQILSDLSETSPSPVYNDELDHQSILIDRQYSVRK